MSLSIEHENSVNADIVEKKAQNIVCCFIIEVLVLNQIKIIYGGERQWIIEIRILLRNRANVFVLNEM